MAATSQGADTLHQQTKKLMFFYDKSPLFYNLSKLQISKVLWLHKPVCIQNTDQRPYYIMRIRSILSSQDFSKSNDCKFLQCPDTLLQLYCFMKSEKSWKYMQTIYTLNIN